MSSNSNGSAEAQAPQWNSPPSLSPSPSPSVAVGSDRRRQQRSRQEEENVNDNEGDDVSVPPTPVRGRSSPSHAETPLTPLTPPQQQEEQAPPTFHDAENEDNNNSPLFSSSGVPDAVIRGTNIHVPTAAETFCEFLRNFRSLDYSRRQNAARSNNDEEEDDDDDESEVSPTTPPPPLFYLSQLQALAEPDSVDATNGGVAVVIPEIIAETSTASLELDARHLYYHNQACQRLYHQLQAYPMELIPLFDICCQRELERMGNTLIRIQVRPFNLPTIHNLRELDPVHMDSLVGVQGMIVRASTILPDLKVAHFSCTLCGHHVQVSVDRGRIEEPSGKCPTCKSKATSCYQLVHNRSIYSDKQWIRLQETPDQVPAGHTPASCLLFAFDDMCDQVLPGDRVEVTAVLRAQPVRTHPKLSKLRTLYKTYLDAVHFRKIVCSAAGTTASNPFHSSQHSSSRVGGQWPPQRVAELKALSQHPNIYENLVKSLAPSIWELDDVKKGVLCMLFGGSVGTPQSDDDDDTEEWLNDENENDDNPIPASKKRGIAHTHKRGDINILLCGDPGTSKSQLLSYVHKISHRGVYTSGKGSSAVGLTASVVRDPETRDLVLESGALVLSDLGICCIDEFDKMSDTTRSVLHEAMEQQTVSIAKAGIIATLHARTSVLASANPTESRYNPNRSVVDNIQLPPTLLSRFDLIYLILDSPQVDQDRRLAQHLVGLYYQTPNVVQPPMDQNLLRDYILYAREHIHPQLSDDAASQLLESYLELRGKGHGSKTISATPRQLESLIRLTEALAKMRYSRIATRADAQEAVRLMRVATCLAATDARTGRIDMDLLTTGRGSEARQLHDEIQVAVQELLLTNTGRGGGGGSYSGPKKLTVREIAQTIQEVMPSSSSGQQMVVEHEELVTVLRVLEAEGMLQYNERTQTVYVRSGIHR